MYREVDNLKSSLQHNRRSLAQLSRNTLSLKNRIKRHNLTKKASAKQGSLTFSRSRRNKYAASTGMAVKVKDDPLVDCNETVSTGPREIVVQPTRKNPAFSADDSLDFKERVSSFEALGLRHDVLKALDSMNVRQPTVIQNDNSNWVLDKPGPLLTDEQSGELMAVKMVAIPKILQRHHVLLAAQTGSGKTISFLAPLVHLLREEEERHGIVARLNRPRSCIVLPSRELAVQVLEVAKSFSHYARFRSTGIIGGRKKKFMHEDLKNPVDLIVATPGTLLKYRQKDALFFSDLTHLVIDEADTMFDSSFKDLTMELLHTIHVRHSKPPPSHSLPIDAQVTIAGATMPDDFLISTLKDIVPSIKKCTAGLHRVLPHVKHVFMKMNNSEKTDHLIQLLRKDVQQGVRTVVFCNSTKACQWLGHCLGSNYFSFIRLHGNIPPEIRCQHFEDFQKGVANIMICTDIASRGLDTSNVGHVINFDFPTSVIDYIHRVGRTGRVGYRPPNGTCRASSFVTHNRDARLARTIEIAAARNTSLEVVQSKR